MRSLLPALVLLTSSVITQAQNLVPNPGFEEITTCPQKASSTASEFAVPGWWSASTGTPDHFHRCSAVDSDVPFNWAGNSNAHSGYAYAGVHVWNKRDDQKSYREYIQCVLAEPLQAGVKYRIGFYFKLSTYALYASDRIGLLLDANPVAANHDGVIMQTPLISVASDSVLANTNGSWERAFITYTATGGERYLVIGNFFDNATTRSKRLPYRFGKSAPLHESSYFYIDDVSVMPLDRTPRQSTAAVEFHAAAKTGISTNTPYTLTNIQYENNSYVLKRSSHEELNKVITYLQANTDVQVRLYGHAQGAGTDEAVLELSRNRARSVAEYLIEKGIDGRRIISYGYGASRPVSLENTEVARVGNNRVEILFITP